MTSISEKIRERILRAKKPFKANSNIHEFIYDGELHELQIEIQGKIEAVLSSLIIDSENDHNTKETAKRVSSMYVLEIFKGRYSPPPKITDFPNSMNLDEIYTVGPITIRSMCSHHMVPITGQCWIGVKPSDRVIGLSKFNRIVDWVMSRPQIQEEAAIMLADELERLINPHGLAVVIKARHQCMTLRGVKDEQTQMVTSVMRGFLRDDSKARAELMHLFMGQGYS